MNFHATTPLDPLGNEIRLLSVLPGRFKEQIRCLLVKASLSSFEIIGNAALAPRSERLSGKEACFVTTLRYSMELLEWSGYEALSYTWGTATNIPITINNEHGFLVTENLAAALRRLRRTVEPRWLWIDAICIDQNNTAERGQQVAMMGEIYKRANAVLIWLGEPDVKIKKPIRGFRAPKRIKKKSLSARRNLPLLLLVEALKVVPSRWWDRTWVIQEFLMASGEPKVLYGPCDLFWSTFQEMVMKGLDADVLKTDAFPNPGRHAYYYIEAFSSLSKGSSIVDLANILKRTKCQDPRDKVYAVLSLISKDERRHILPDYSKPCSEIYATATFAALHTDQSCRALHLASSGLSALEGLPSWAIDFSSEGPQLDLSYMPVELPTHTDTSHYYHIGYKSTITNLPSSLDRSQTFMMQLQSSRKMNFQTDLSSDARLLAVSGRMIDQVQVCIQLPISNETKPTEESLATVWQIYRILRQLGPPSPDETIAEERPVHCSEGNHSKDCVRFHASLCTRFNICSLRSLEHSDITDEKVISLLNTLYTDFHSHATSTVPELSSNFPNPWGEAWNDPYRWLYLDRLKHGLVFFTTITGFIGCATTEVVAGDSIALLDHSKSPCVLRRVGGQSTFHGFVYVESPTAGDLGIYCGDHSFEDMDFVLC
jgi:hypothetical protein